MSFWRRPCPGRRWKEGRSLKASELHLSETAGASFFGRSVMGKPASADGGKGIGARIAWVHGPELPGQASKATRSPFAEPIANGGCGFNAAGSIRILRVGP